MNKHGLLIGAGFLTASVLSLAGRPASASSHREAPLMTQDPSIDNTDLWAFTSPDAPNTVTIIAGYIGLEEPGGGPNWSRFADDAMYSIRIDNTGDGVPDINYNFTFQTSYNNALATGAGGTFFYNVGQINGLPTPGNFHNALVAQTMTVTRTTGAGAATVIGANVPTAPIYVGRWTFGGVGNNPAPDDTAYTAIANQAITPLTMGSGETVFAGPADDPFFVDLGDIFDDVSVRHLVNPPMDLGSRGGGVDFLQGLNVHVIAIQIPVATIAPMCTTMNSPNCVVGIYASGSRPRVVVNGGPNGRVSHGQMVQVSRLGIPLVNEVLIPLEQKDFWNTTNPWQDATNFGPALLVPSLPTYAQALYGASGIRAPLGYVAPVRTPTATNDLLALVTGVGLIPGVPATGLAPADELRLNVLTPSTSIPSGTASRLGAAGGDANGFPNGRRLADDVVDIEERYVLNGLATINAIPFGDGVDANDVPFRATFPFVAVPHPGDQPHSQLPFPTN